MKINCTHGCHKLDATSIPRLLLRIGSAGRSLFKQMLWSSGLGFVLVQFCIQAILPHHKHFLHTWIMLIAARAFVALFSHFSSSMLFSFTGHLSFHHSLVPSLHVVCCCCCFLCWAFQVVAEVACLKEQLLKDNPQLSELLSDETTAYHTQLQAVRVQHKNLMLPTFSESTLSNTKRI